MEIRFLVNTSYYLNPYAFPLFVTSFLVILFGLYVFIQDNNPVSRSFLLLTISAGVWQAGIGILYLSKDTLQIISFYKVFTFLGVVTIAPGIYMLTVSSLGLLESKKRFIVMNYIIALIFYILSLTTDWLAVGVKEYFWGRYVLYGPLSFPFLIFFSALVIGSLQMLYQNFKNMEPGTKRDQLKLLLISLSIAILGAVDFLACYPSMPVYPFGYIPVLLFLSLQTYAIIRYEKATLSEIFQAIDDGIVVIDRNNRIIQINPSMEKITNIRKKDFIGKSPIKVFSSLADQFENPERVNEVLEEIMTKYSRINGLDVSYRDSAKHINVSSSPIIDRFGNVSGNVILLKDITARKRMEQELNQYKEKLEDLVEVRTRELKNSEEKYKALVSHAQVGIGIHYEGKLVFVNKQLASMLGYTEEEGIGKSIGEFIHPDDVKLVMSRAWDRYKGKEVLDTYDFRLIRKDGSFMPALISNATIEYQGKNATLITIVDTTDTKLRKELEMVNKELEMFAYSVSHDLRAPLRSIDGFSQVLLEDYQDKLDEEGKDYLIRLRAASQRMGALISAILKLSRLGRSEMKQEQVDLSVLAHEVARDLKENDPTRKVEFIIEEGIIALGDKTLLQVVLENLIGNAWKFTQKHDHAKIEFGVMNNDGISTYFVRDDGAGFDMKHVDKLFAPFHRLHSNAEFEGTGIGLASVQRIIHRHGGNIWVDSIIEKGTTFYFTLGC